MLIGLPSCGKTYWANQFVKRNLSKRYYLIGIGSILEKMKVRNKFRVIYKVKVIIIWVIEFQKDVGNT